MLCESMLHRPVYMTCQSGLNLDQCVMKIIVIWILIHIVR